MSIRIMAQVWTLDIPPTEKLVLMALADRSNDEGACWPGQESLAKKCSISERQLRRVLDSLETQNFIRITYRQGDGNGRKTNYYELQIPAESYPQATGHLRQPDICDRGATGHLRGGNRTSEGGQPDTHVRQYISNTSEDTSVLMSKKKNSPQKTDPPNTKNRRFSSVDLSVARFFFEQLVDINPNHKKPNLEAWANTIWLMRERDGRKADDMRAMIAWATCHEFWSANILSPAKLRKHWDRMAIQKTNGARTHETRNGSGKPQSAAERARRQAESDFAGITAALGGRAIHEAKGEVYDAMDVPF